MRVQIFRVIHHKANEVDTSKEWRESSLTLMEFPHSTSTFHTCHLERLAGQLFYFTLNENWHGGNTAEHSCQYVKPFLSEECYWLAAVWGGSSVGCTCLLTWKRSQKNIHHFRIKIILQIHAAYQTGLMFHTLKLNLVCCGRPCSVSFKSFYDFYDL